MREWKKMVLKASGEANSPASSCVSQTSRPKDLLMWGKMGGQQLQDTAFATDQTFGLPMMEKSRHSALQPTERSLALFTVTEHLLPARTNWSKARVWEWHCLRNVNLWSAEQDRSPEWTTDHHHHPALNSNANPMILAFYSKLHRSII